MERVISANALAEVKHYLKGIKQADIDKIPKELIQYINDNSANDYQCNFDYNAPLKDIDLLEESRGIIGMICYDYWCDTEEKKKRFRAKLYENELKHQDELRKQYNPNDIFKNSAMNLKSEEVIEDSTSLIEVEESFFKKLINRVKAFFRKEK